MACFVLYVKRGYRDVPYHNWHHAFNVAQWAYATMINYKLVQKGYLTLVPRYTYTGSETVVIRHLPLQLHNAYYILPKIVLYIASERTFSLSIKKSL